MRKIFDSKRIISCILAITMLITGISSVFAVNEEVELMYVFSSEKAPIHPTGRGYRFDYDTKTLYISDATNKSPTSGSEIKFGWYTCAVNTENPTEDDNSYHRLSDTIVRICDITERIVIEEGVTEIGNYVFQQRARLFPKLKSMSLPSTLTTIGVRAFQNFDFKSLGVDMTAFENITAIGNYGFSACSFGSVEFLSLTSTGECPFTGSEFDSLVFSNEFTNPGQYSFASITVNSGELILPDSVKSLKYGMFDHSNINTVDIGSGVRSISHYAFKKANISNLYIHNTPFTINNYIFEGSSISDIWYYGTESEAKKYITNYGTGNSDFYNATWHYMSEISVAPIEDQYYFGGSVEPKIQADFYDAEQDILIELKEGLDFEVSYYGNNSVGSGTANIKYIGDYAYEGTESLTFNILEFDPTKAPTGPIDVSDVVFEVADTTYSWPYDITTTVRGSYTYSIGGNTYIYQLSECVDFEVTYENNTSAGLASVIITGLGEFEGECELDFTIHPFNLKEAEAKKEYYLTQVDAEWFDYNECVYNGTAIEPRITWLDIAGYDDRILTLWESEFNVNADDQFYVTYENNCDAGTATYIFHAISPNFTGEYRGTFEIEVADIEGITFENVSSDEEMMYKGGPVIPEMYFYYEAADGAEDILYEGIDYTIEYIDNEEVGTATAILTGIGNFTGTKSIEYEVLEPVLSAVVDEVSMSDVSMIIDESFMYDGRAKEVNPTLTYVYTNVETGSIIEFILTEGTDYEITRYENNIDAGTAIVTIAGIGNVTGTNDGTFIIMPKSADTVTISPIEDKVYTGTEIMPDIVVTDFMY